MDFQKGHGNIDIDFDLSLLTDNIWLQQVWRPYHKKLATELTLFR